MKHIVVLGAGYAGLRTVVRLQKQLHNQVYITLINQNPYHYQTTALHEVAAGNVAPEKICFDIADLVDSSITSLIIDRVTSFDPHSQTVYLADHDDLHYDYCVVALGFVSETFGINGAAENALPMTTVRQAIQINEHITNQMAAFQQDHDSKHLHIIICGAGFTGIELAGELADARPRYAKLAGVQPDQIQIEMIDASQRLLPMFNEQLADYGVGILHKLNIKITQQALIQKIEPELVAYRLAEETADDQLHQSKAGTIIWTTGVSGSSLVAKAGLKQCRGRVMVSPHLTAPGDDKLYLIGDVAAVMPPGGQRPYPTTAQIALSMANYVADDLVARLNGQLRPDAYRYHSQGTVASIGNTRALGMAGNHSYMGYPASVLKKMIMNKSLLALGGAKQVLHKGRFDLYH